MRLACLVGVSYPSPATACVRRKKGSKTWEHGRQRAHATRSSTGVVRACVTPKYERSVDRETRLIVSVGASNKTNGWIAADISL